MDWRFKIKAQKPFEEDVAPSPMIQEDVGAPIPGSQKAPEGRCHGLPRSLLCYAIL